MSWVQRLGDLVGATAVDHVSHPGTDAPLPRVAPEGEEAWRAVLELARSEGLRCLPTGSGSHLADTDLTGVELLLSTRRGAGIVAYEPGDGTLTARAGTPWTELASVVAAGGHHLSPEFAPDFPGTLGGVIASARSGFERLRYGPLRHQVLGLRFLLADGTAAQSGGRLVKNVTGYDLHRLLAGSAGSMAVILEASLRLAPEPARRRVLTARFDDPGSLLEASGTLRDLPLAPEALRVHGEARGELELSLFLAGRAATVDWELERARAAVPALVEPPDAGGARASAVAAEHARDDGNQRLRVTLRPSRLGQGLSEITRRLESHDLAPRLIAHPWLATLTYDFRADGPEALAAFAAEVPDLLAPFHAHHSWSGAPAERPSSEPVDRVRRYGDRLRTALDPDALFAGAGSQADPRPHADPRSHA